MKYTLNYSISSFCSNLETLTILVQESIFLIVLLKLLKTGWGYQETDKNDYFRDELRLGVGIGGLDQSQEEND